MKKNENKKARKKGVKKVVGKKRGKSPLKTGARNKSVKSKRKSSKENKPIASIKHGNEKRTPIENPKRIKKEIRAKNETTRPNKRANVIQSKKGVKFNFTSKSFLQKVRQIIDWSGNELKKPLAKQPKKVYFKMQIVVPQNMRSEKKEDKKTKELIPKYSKNIFVAIPSRKGSKLNIENIKKGMANLTSEYNNEKLELVESLDYDIQPKIWDLKNIFLEFIY